MENKTVIEQNGFSQKWQQAIFRNYGTVENSKLAEVLNTTETVIETEAERMGLNLIKYNPDWVKKGFVTIVRNNWDLLTKTQIRTLLSMGEKEFDRFLIYYDFLDVKVGAKPELEAPVYSPLSKEEIEKTAKIKDFMIANYKAPEVMPFDFFSNSPENVYEEPEEYEITDRYVSSYFASYDGVLDDDELKDYPADYLDRLKKTGINGIWIQETLRNITPFPFDEKYSIGYEKRLANLEKLTERCAEHGLGVYIYLNEPRSLPEEFFEKYPHLKGQITEKNEYCLCTSTQEVKDYLFNATRFLVRNVPLLKGIMTITMSENATHCASRLFVQKNQGITLTCERCKKRKPEEMSAEISNIMMSAVRAENSKTQIIANLWAWSIFSDWTEEMILHGIDCLDKDITVMCVSEAEKDLCRGGVPVKVFDYSISVVGPSDSSIKMLKRAKENGHKIWAKIQVNNSWELSSVPYIPTFGLMVKHIENLKELGVSGLMMGWSLGGYPGGALPICNGLCSKKPFDLNTWYDKTYAENSDIVKKAVSIFDDAFTNLPFSLANLYNGPDTLGVANLWTLERSNRSSTMTCFAMDDYEAYVYPYGAEIYISQYKLLCDAWEKGLELLKGVNGNLAFEELKRCAFTSFNHFKGAMLHTEYAYYKRNAKENKTKLLEIIKEDAVLVKELYEIIQKDAKIGFEMTNHYFYNSNLLLEKLLNLDYLKGLVENL